MDKTYTMTYVCPNCGRNYVQSFEYGEKAVQGTCPLCGVDGELPEWTKEIL